MSADEAGSLARQVIARAWAERDRLSLRLPPSRLTLEPGNVIELPLNPAAWTVDQVRIEGFAVLAEMRPLCPSPTSEAVSAAIRGASARMVEGAAAIEPAESSLTLALFDVPIGWSGAPGTPQVLIAASIADKGWRRGQVEVSFGDQTIIVETARRKSILGNSATLLSAAPAELVDRQNSLEVQLIDHEQWLTSCDDDQLCAGANLAIVGSELLQFADASPLGNGRFRLSRLLRGRAGTEWAAGRHAMGEAFCMVDFARLREVSLPAWSLGSDLVARCNDISARLPAFRGISVRPPSPVNLSGEVGVAGELSLSWTARSRTGWAWIDEVDAVLAETREQYRVDVRGADSAIRLVVEQPSAMLARSELGIGSGSVSIEVRQIGDFGLSEPAELTIEL